MVGRPKIIRTPEKIKELNKKRRAKNKKYFQKYSKYYYLKRCLENPDRVREYARQSYLRKKERGRDNPSLLKTKQISK